MHCPNCGDVEFQTKARLELTFCHCPRCGGVWLSRNELQRLSERTGLFLKGRGGGSLPAAGVGLKRPLWQELFDVGP